MGERLKEFESAKEDGFVDQVDWLKHLQHLTIDDWRKVVQTYGAHDNDGKSPWVEEKASEFVVHNNSDNINGQGWKGTLLTASEWLSPIALPAAALGITSLMRMSTGGKLLSMAVGAMAGMGWSVYRMERASELRQSAVPLRIPKDLLNGSAQDKHLPNSQSRIVDRLEFLKPAEKERRS